jgi:hypothetical protein
MTAAAKSFHLHRTPLEHGFGAPDFSWAAAQAVAHPANYLWPPVDEYLWCMCSDNLPQRRAQTVEKAGRQLEQAVGVVKFEKHSLSRAEENLVGARFLTYG